MANVIRRGSDHDITVTGLYGGTGYLNSATVTYELLDAAGTAIAGGSGTLDYTAASNGDYAGVMESTVTETLTPGARHTLIYTAVQGQFNWRWAETVWAVDGG